MRRRSMIPLLAGLPVLSACVSKRYRVNIDHIIQQQQAEIEKLETELDELRSDRQTTDFAWAYSQASNFTGPVVVSARHFDRVVESSLAAFVVINSDGWVITAAHIFEYQTLFQEHAPQIAFYNQQREAILANGRLPETDKNQKLAALQTNRNWIVNFSEWWAGDGFSVQDVRFLRELDIAVGRLEPFDSKSHGVFPTFKNPSHLSSGTSLCKLGFPFHQVQTTWDERAKAFRFSPDALPIPRFPIEGMYTRTIDYGRTANGKYPIRLLETSSPGLRGQSGGPIFDTSARIWSIQSETDSLPLDFNVPNQYLNVGRGIHPEVLVQFLRDSGIDFVMSRD